MKTSISEKKNTIAKFMIIISFVVLCVISPLLLLLALSLVCLAIVIYIIYIFLLARRFLNNMDEGKLSNYLDYS
ncbi:hypothetical protein BMS3Abin15_00488 [bacterium BMS3Abin15]|nr:hypothetical protein BMS3Abin15_00488 [bacterium BMS3Abin15]